MAADRCCGADRGLDASRQLVILAPGNRERILVDVPVNMEASMVEGEREHTDKDRDRESQERQRERSGSRER